jgi:cysteine desulfurase
MAPYFSDNYFNPSALYLAARGVRKDVEAARAKVAYWFGSRPSEVTFTAGGTEANNLAIYGVMNRYPGANIVVAASDHEAVLKPAGQFEVKIAPVKTNGIVDLEALAGLIDDKTVLVSIAYANNEIGTIQPLGEISQIISKKRAERAKFHLPLLFHTDACQAANYLDLHVSRLGVDMMSINAGKIYGPKQVGALYVRTGVELAPIIRGGGQERQMRSGTENVAGVVGLAAALDLVQGSRHEEVARLKKLQKLFFDLLKEKFPAVVINGSLKNRLPNNIHITIPGQDNERLMMQLDERGIMVAIGSACSASSEEPSHVLKAIGLSDEDSRSSLRMTMGRNTTEQALRRVIETLSDYI